MPDEKPAAEKKTHRRRFLPKWLMVCLGIVLLVLIFILILPSLLCTGPGVQILESQINSRIAGHIKIGGLSMGWISPVNISHVTVLDPAGAVVVNDASVHTHLSLLDLLSNWHNLGSITIPISSVHLAMINGKLNLLRAFAGRSVATAPASPATSPPPSPSVSSAPTSGSSAPSSSSAQSGPAIPSVAGRLDLSIAHLTWDLAGQPPVRGRKLTIAATFNTRSAQPTDVKFACLAGIGTTPPAPVTMHLRTIAFSKLGLLPLPLITGQLTIKSTHLDVACLNPILQAAGIRLRVAGLLTTRGAVSLKAHLSIMADGTLVCRHTRLAGSALKGDSPRLGTVLLSANAAGGQSAYRIKSLQLSSSRLGQLAVTGRGSIRALMAAVHHSAAAGAAPAHLHMTLQTNIAAWLAAFPHLLKAPVGAKFSGGAFTLSVGLKTDTASAASAAAATLPPVSFLVATTLKPLSWTLPAHRHGRQAYGMLNLSGSTLGAPININTRVYLSHGAAKPSTIVVRGALSPFEQMHIAPLDAITGKLGIQVSNVYMSYFKIIRLPFSAAGTLNGKLQLDSPRPHQGALTGNLQIDGLALGGKYLHGDHPVLGHVGIPLNITWAADRVKIQQFQVLCPAATMGVSGGFGLKHIAELGKTGGDWGHCQLIATLLMNTALIARDFRHTLRIRHLPLRIKKGHIGVTINMRGIGRTSSAFVAADVSSQHCLWKGEKAVISPLSFEVAAQRRAAHWRVTLVNAKQMSASKTPLWKINLNAIPNAPHPGYRVDAIWHLAGVAAELGQFVALNGKTAAGTFAISGALNNILTVQPQLQLQLQGQHLTYTPGFKKPALQIPAITVPLNAQLNLVKGSAAATFSLQSTMAQITGGTVTIASSPLAIPQFHITLKQINLADAWPLIAAFSPAAAHYRVAGNVENTQLSGAYEAGHLSVPRLRLHLTQLSVGRASQKLPTFTEPKVDVQLAADIHTGKSAAVDVSTLSVLMGDNALTVVADKPIHVTTGSAMVLNAPAVKLTADLSKLQNLFLVLGKLKSGSSLKGKVVLTAGIKGNSHAMSLMAAGQAAGYQMISPGAKTSLPPTNISMNVNGNADLAAKTFTALRTCKIGEHSVSGSGGNLLTLDKGSILAWGPGGVENINGSFTYSLGRLVTLLKAFLPPTLSASGTGTMPLAVRGPLTHKPGLMLLQKLTIMPTALAFKSITADGADLGPGSVGLSESNGKIIITPSAVPANKGTVNLGGYIDLTGPFPRFVLSVPLQLAKNVDINAPMGATVLNFLPLTWGNQGSPALLNVSGLLNLSLQNASLPLSMAQMKKTGTASGTVSITHLTTNAPFAGQISALAAPLGANVAIADSGIRPTAFTLKAGRVSYQNMKLVLVSFGMDLSGWVGLNKQMNIDVNITGGGLTLPIPLKLTGSTSAPKMQLSSHPLKNIGNTIKTQIPGLLKGIFGH